MAQPDPGDDDEPPTLPQPARWTGSARVPEQTGRKRRGVLREPTLELPIITPQPSIVDEEPWPPPPPPRPVNAPVTAPYPPPPPPVPYRPASPSRPAIAAPARPAPAPVRRQTRKRVAGPYPPAGPYPEASSRPPQPSGPPRYRRRRRRWPWMLLLLTVACCGCCGLAARPFLTEYPATVALPAQAAGLVKRDDDTSRKAAGDLERRVRAEHWLAEDTFAAIYAEPAGRQRSVTVYGATKLVIDPERELRSAFTRLIEEMALVDVAAADPGPMGGHGRCGAGNRGTSVCGWADHGSLAVAVFPDRNRADSLRLLADLRAAVLTRE